MADDPCSDRGPGVAGDRPYRHALRLPWLALSLIETAKLHGLDPQAYLRCVLERIGGHLINRIDKLLLGSSVRPSSRLPSDPARPS
jgi:hypothetical protein